MELDIRLCVITALLTLPLSVSAETVQRCVDAQGNTTFTTLGCPPGHFSSLHNAHNPKPGTVIATPTPTTHSAAARSRELVVVGEHDDGCGNRLGAVQRRKAIINQQTPAGMTRRDVESLLGKPDKIISRNAEQRYVYKEKNGRTRQVRFDENGCVMGTQRKRKP